MSAECGVCVHCRRCRHKHTFSQKAREARKQSTHPFIHESKLSERNMCLWPLFKVFFPAFGVCLMCACVCVCVC